MTDKFDIRIVPIKRYVRYKGGDSVYVFIRFDIEKDGVAFDGDKYGMIECCDTDIKNLIKVAGEYIAGESVECTGNRIVFSEPRRIDYCNYYFEIKEDRWIFVYSNKTGETSGIEYSYEINREQIKSIYDSLVRQMEEFDWANYGKIEGYKFSRLFGYAYEWCYSAKDLQEKLRNILIGDKLKSIYIGCENYIDLPVNPVEYIDCWNGSLVFLAFENHLVDILVHAEGLFQMRIYRPNQVLKKRCYDFVDYYDDNLMCDIKDVFSLDYTDAEVVNVDVEDTDVWAWTPDGFDKTNIGEKAELPDCISLDLGNGTRLSVIGDIEDFIIRVEKI